MQSRPWQAVRSRVPEVVGKWLLAAFSASDGLVEVIALWDQLVVDGIQAGGAGLELAKLGKLAKI